MINTYLTAITSRSGRQRIYNLIFCLELTGFILGSAILGLTEPFSDVEFITLLLMPGGVSFVSYCSTGRSFFTNLLYELPRNFYAHWFSNSDREIQNNAPSENTQLLHNTNDNSYTRAVQALGSNDTSREDTLYVDIELTEIIPRTSAVFIQPRNTSQAETDSNNSINNDSENTEIHRQFK